MKLLLDTHIWLWNALEPQRLARRVRREFADEANELWLSPVSAWEATLLISKRKVEIDVALDEWFEQELAHLREAPLTHQIVLAAHHLPWPHRDPADRLLAATAQVLGLTLVTADERLLGLGDIRSLANR